MQSSFFKRTMPKLIFALVALTMGIFVSRGDSYAAGSFTASSNATPSSLATNANADITTVLNIPINDYNFSSVINGTPAAGFIAPGPGSPGFVGGVHPSLGEVVGTLTSSSSLGLTGNPCTSAVTPGFTFLNATVDNSAANEIDPVPQASTNPGSGGTLDNMWSDNGSSTTGPGATAPWNAAWPGLTVAERTNGLPAQVDAYPSYLNTIFDPDGVSGADPFTGVQPVQPLARYAGATNVVGTSVVLDLVVFAPGVLANAGFGANHPFTATSTIGYTSIAVLNDPTVEASHGSISDFCSPLGTTAITYGIAKTNPCKGGGGGAACDTAPEISAPTAGANTLNRYSNPAYGASQAWISQHESLRDFDGDGVENSLDACALVVDTYNPRAPAGGDADSDGMPDPCDPNDADGNTDHDGDGWENSYDNCPLASNPTQADNEQTVAYSTTAPTGGPRGDSIGDACDSDNTVSDGAFLTTTTTNNHTITGVGAVDSDGDGISDTAETNVGTSTSNRCGQGSEAGGPGPWPGVLDDGTSLAWALDFRSAGIFGSTDKILIDDLNSFLSPRKLDLDLTGATDPVRRWDLSPGKGIFATDINISDLNQMLSGVTAFPKMMASTPAAGVKALGGPSCVGQ
jgi:hypothetical protein